jgi:drug/metabolite transporter (DMT)-like permease
VTLRAHGAVVVAAVLFGTTFVMVKDAVADVGPVPFLAVRFLVGAATMAPFALRRPAEGRSTSPPGVWQAGLVCGAALLLGYVFQTVGLQYTTSSVSAFVTYLLVVMVPVISALTLRRPPTPPTIAGVVLATAGLFLLTGRGVHLGKGELLTLGCALSFAVHIVLLAHFAPRFDTTKLNGIQLLVVGGACLVPGLWLGGYGFTLRAWLAAAYTGVAVSGVALGLQLWGQRQVGPTRTSLLLMIEPVSAAGLGYAVGDRLGVGGVVGALLILAGIAVAEFPVARRGPSAS